MTGKLSIFVVGFSVCESKTGRHFFPCVEASDTNAVSESGIPGHLGP